MFQNPVANQIPKHQIHVPVAFPHFFSCACPSVQWAGPDVHGTWWADETQGPRGPRNHSSQGQYRSIGTLYGIIRYRWDIHSEDYDGLWDIYIYKYIYIYLIGIYWDDDWWGYETTTKWGVVRQATLDCVRVWGYTQFPYLNLELEVI